jgi:hypothetical protein
MSIEQAEKGSADAYSRAFDNLTMPAHRGPEVQGDWKARRQDDRHPGFPAGGTLIIAPDGGDASALTKPKPSLLALNIAEAVLEERQSKGIDGAAPHQRPLA